LRYDCKQKKYRNKIKTPEQKKNINEINFITRKNKIKQLKNKKGANKKPFTINKIPV